MTENENALAYYTSELITTLKTGQISGSINILPLPLMSEQNKLERLSKTMILKLV